MSLHEETYESLSLRNPKMEKFLELAELNPEEARRQMKNYFKRITKYAAGIDIQQMDLESKIIFAKHAINNEGVIKIIAYLRNYRDAIRGFEEYFKLKRLPWSSETSPRYDTPPELWILITFFNEPNVFNTYFSFGKKYGTPKGRLKQLIEALGGSENIEKIRIKG